MRQWISLKSIAARIKHIFISIKPDKFSGLSARHNPFFHFAIPESIS